MLYSICHMTMMMMRANSNGSRPVDVFWKAVARELHEQDREHCERIQYVDTLYEHSGVVGDALQDLYYLPVVGKHVIVASVNCDFRWLKYVPPSTAVHGSVLTSRTETT